MNAINDLAAKSLYNAMTKLVITALFPIVSYAQNASVCDIKFDPNGTGVLGRSYALTLPNNEQLIIVGHIHGQTETVLKLLQFFKDEEPDNSKFLASARERLKVLADTARHFREDEQFLRDLALNKKIKFIGTEADPDISDFYNEIERGIDTGIKRVIGQRRLDYSQMIDETKLVLMGAPRYARKAYPKLLKDIPVLAIEDSQLLDKEVAARETASDAVLKILRDKFPFEQYNKIGLDFLGVFFRYAEMEKWSDTDIIAAFNAVLPEQVRKEVRPHVEQMKDAVRLVNQRDHKNIESLFAAYKKSGGGGIHFIGLAHLQSLAVKLTDSCRKEFGIQKTEAPLPLSEKPEASR